MKVSVLLAAGLPLVAPLSLSAAVKSGHAEADLIAGVPSYQPGKPFPVAVRLTVDPGWHTYWINPGVGGMPVKATWTLPEGWTAGELQQPVPKRFMTGELPGFGYEGEVLFLVDLTPPAGATGEAECKVKLAWLTCDDSACVPGDAELSVKLAAGDGGAAKDAARVEAAARKIPREPGKKAAMMVFDNGGTVTLILSNVTSPEVDLSEVEVLPATPDVVDPAAIISLARIDPNKPQENKALLGLGRDHWFAHVKKSEYIAGFPARFDVVLAGGKLEQPLVISWRSKE